jgi:cytochrome P450
MARSMLEDDAALPPEHSELSMIKDVTGVAYIAGSDTTVAAVHSYFLAMLIWPEIQTKAQAEVDRVIGKDRLPEFNDAPRMPYIQGIINECLRWIPVAPMGKQSLHCHLCALIMLSDLSSALPHATTRDDEYKGYLIPKGTLVFGALWSEHNCFSALMMKLN